MIILRKISVFLIMVILTFNYASAQDSLRYKSKDVLRKGNMYLSLTLEYYHNNNSTNTIISPTISNISDVIENRYKIIPEVGYFLNKNLSLGVGIGYNKNFISNKVSNNSIITNFKNESDGLILRVNPTFYKSLIKNSFFAMVSIPLEYNSNKVVEFKQDSVNNWNEIRRFNSDLFSMSINLGLSYFFSSKFSVEASINIFGLFYQDYGYTFPQQSNTRRFWTSFSSSPGYNPLLINFKYYIK